MAKELEKALAVWVEESVPEMSLTQSEDAARRHLEFLAAFTAGYSKNVAQLVEGALYPYTGRGTVSIAPLPFASLCEHHLAPFMGEVSIAYAPNSTILGISRFANIVGAFSARLQLQERLCAELAQAINEALNPRAVLVSIKARHSCMCVSASAKHLSNITTRSFVGEEGTRLSLEQIIGAGSDG